MKWPLRMSMLLSLAGIAACASTREPLAHSARDGLLAVHAVSAQDADIVLQLARELYPAVAGVPHMLPMREVELRVWRDSGRFSSGANRWKGEVKSRRQSWIELHLGSDATQYRWILAHELSHYLLGDEWLPLPMIVEEGLCDTIAERLDPATGASRRLSHAVLLSSWLGPGLYVTQTQPETGRSETVHLRVRIDPDELPSIVSMLRFDEKSYHSVRDPKHNQLLYAFGYLLVNRIGIEKLSQLCSQARTAGVETVPPEWLLAAAGIRPGDAESWKRAVDGLIGSGELDALERSVGEGKLTVE
jgi:hypothetical protein